ncbi:prevent-host-death protein [Lentzea sp. PSKA42]|uniref:Prevent-host-death protein n=1 Tax=Lentzea indica TaxID=2604800 RepID=A0ABX1FH10_9PSEU|nr:prevent-host-death protein [Lentzea indica]NKE57907.1 prevent-host-death protein [Lentzea indica]
MTQIVSAIPVVAEHTGRPVVLIGGLAVMCRLSVPYRVTTDLDTVDRRTSNEDSQLQLLMAAGATPSGPVGALVHTPWGEVKVDVLEVTDADVSDLPDDPNDRLHVQSHAWAASTASALLLSAEGVPALSVRVAEPGPIIAMKLQSVMNRGAAKEGTDLLDIARITLDRACGPTSRDQLESADSQMRADALLHTRLWFDRRDAQTLSKIRAVPEGRDMEIDDVRLVGELLVSALEH